MSISTSSALFILIAFQVAFGAVLDQFFNDAVPCELRCNDAYTESADFKKSCAEGCRLFKIIGLAKGYNNNNKTLGLCISACTEAFVNETSANACNYGCRQRVSAKSKPEETQTLHLLTPLFYMRSAYNAMVHHARQFITTSWTVYVQEDSGKMIVLQSNPKVQNVVIESEYPVVEKELRYVKPSDDRLDWMDCISHQSGIPRWLLVIVLFGFILALLWLCCATAVTAPNHYMSSKKKNVSYVLLCEPNHDLKPPPPLINCDEDAPPLPPKVSLI